MPHNTLEKRRAYDRKYKETHREQLREYERNYRKKYRQTDKGRKIIKNSKLKYSRKSDVKIKHNIWRLKVQYNLTIEQYQNLLQEQNNRCGICGIDFDDTKQGPCIDHDHEENYVRGLLCSHCNWAIGLLKDDISKFQNAIDYLVRTQHGRNTP